jgi:hypothetical protein
VRVREARPEGVTEVNQWLKLRNSEPGSNLMDTGRLAARDRLDFRVGSTPKPCSSIGGEAMLKACGVGMAMLPE